MSFSVSTLDSSSAAQVSNYAANMQRLADTNPSTQAGTDAVVRNVTAFYNKGEDLRDAGANINLADGINAFEYKSIAQAISMDETLKPAIIDNHNEYTNGAQNNYAQEIRIGPNNEDIGAQIGDTHFGEFGTYANGIRNENGAENDSFEKAANDLSLLTQSVVTAPLTNKAQGGGGGGEAGGAGESGGGPGETADANAANQEKNAAKGASDNAATDTGGGATDTGGQVSLWPFLMGLLFDEDGDGNISLQEMMKGLKKLDKNGDGKVSKDELKAAGATDAQADKMLAAMDKNGDASISLEGADSEAEVFMASANQNGDELISEQEFTTAANAVSETNSAATSEAALKETRMTQGFMTAKAA